MSFSDILALCFMIGVALYLAFEFSRRRKRKKSLRRTDDGGWIWIEFDCSVRRSSTKPDEPGGDWYESGGGDGGGDGGGGD